MAARIDIVAHAVDKATAVLKNVNKELAGVRTQGQKVADANREIMTGWQKAGDASKGIGAVAMRFGKLAGVAGVAAVVTSKVLGKVQEFGGKADQIKILEKSVDGFAGVMDKARVASAGMISDAQLAKSMAMFQAFGLDMSQFSAATEAATKTSIRLGTDGGKAFEDLALAIARGSFKILDNLGVMMTQEEVNQRVFETTGKLTGEFSAQENQSAMLALALERLQAVNANVDPYDSSTAAIERMNTAFSNLAQTMLGSLAEGFGTLADFVMGVESASEKMGVAGAKAYEELRKVPELFGQGFGISPDEWSALETRAQSFANAQMENIQKLNRMEEANVITKSEQAEALSRLDDIRTEYLTEQLELLREQNDAASEKSIATEGELAELQDVIAFNEVALQQMDGMTDAEVKQTQIKASLATAQKGLNKLAGDELAVRLRTIATLQDQLIDIKDVIAKASRSRGGRSGPTMKQQIAFQRAMNRERELARLTSVDLIALSDEERILQEADNKAQLLRNELLLKQNILKLKGNKFLLEEAKLEGKIADIYADAGRKTDADRAKKEADAAREKAKNAEKAAKETEKLAEAENKLVAKLDAASAAMRNQGAVLSEMSPEMGIVMEGAAGLTDVYSAFEDGQITVAQAIGGTVVGLRNAAAQFIEDQRTKAGVMAAFSIAQAAAAFASANPVAGAAHLVAAGLFGAIAGGAGGGSVGQGAMMGGGQDPSAATGGHSALGGGGGRTVIVQFGSGVVLGRPQDVAGAIGDAQYANRGTGRDRRAF